MVLEDNDPWGILPVKILHFFSFKPEIEIMVEKEKFQEIIKEISKFAWNKLLNFLSYRERSTEEVRRYLRELPLRHDLAEEIIEKAISYNYLNEKRFCELYILDLQNKFKSRKEITEKLRVKGVNRALIEASLEEHFNGEKEEDALKILFEKAQTKFSKYPKFQKREKVLNYLTRKGFSYWQAKEIMEKE